MQLFIFTSEFLMYTCSMERHPFFLPLAILGLCALTVHQGLLWTVVLTSELEYRNYFSGCLEPLAQSPDVFFRETTDILKISQSKEELFLR